MTITDAQLHIWEPDRPDRPWDRRFHPQLPEPFTAEQAVALLDAHGIDRAVLVPPLLSGTDSVTANAYVLEAVAAHPGRFAVMGRFDPRPPDAPDRLARWLEQPGMRGIRFSLEGPPAPQWLDEGALDWFWPAAERLGVPVYVFRPGRPDELAAIAARHPGLPICCNHLALDATVTPDALDAHLDALRVLVPHQNVILTISALASRSHEPYPFADVHPALRRLRAEFGAARLAWATDYTAARSQRGEGVSYAQLRDVVEAALPDLTPDERADIFDGTIARFLRWPA